MRRRIINFEPGNPAVAPDVICRLDTPRVVQRTNVDLDRPSAVIGAKRNLRATIRTELSLPMRGRSVNFRLAFCVAEGVCQERHKWQNRASRQNLTDSTVAITAVDRIFLRFETYGTT